MAVGALHNNDNGLHSGHVRLFTCSSTTNKWNRLGNALVGASSGDRCGASASMSAYGMTVAVGACVNDDNGSWSSHARIFTYYSIPKKCNRLGNTLAGATSGD